MFKKFSQDQLSNAIRGKEELVTCGAGIALLIRKSKDGKIQILTSQKSPSWGAFTYVWPMENLVSGKQYALAVNKDGNKEYITRMLEEADVTQKIREKIGDEILEIHSIIRESDDVYVLMEYCTGGTFDDFRDEMREKNDYRQYLTRTLDLIKIISKLHEIKFTHNDLHKCNVYTGPSDEKDLIDFFSFF